jgi:adenosylmethionine-8-amino-7-oxononanoate aminotransferase
MVITLSTLTEEVPRRRVVALVQRPRASAAGAGRRNQGAARRIAHSTFLGLSHVPGIELAEKLIHIAPEGLKRVFYPTTARRRSRRALKIAVQYWQLNGETKRTRIASLAEAYHGDTVGSMSVGYAETFHRFHRDLLFPCCASTRRTRFVTTSAWPKRMRSNARSRKRERSSREKKIRSPRLSSSR